MPAKRYVVDSPAHAGSYFERFCWTVRDTQPENPATGGVVMSGGEREARSWARQLNGRS